MKRATDFRRIARDALKGRWGIAVLAGFLAAILGAADTAAPKVNFSFESGEFSAGLKMFGQTLFSTTGDGIFAGLVFSWLVVLAIVSAIALFVVGSVVRVGYARFHLDLVDRHEDVKVNTLFAYFPHWKNAVLTNLLQAVYIFLWGLLLVIPGIVAAYSYAMTGYLLAENPQLTASEAIAQSKELMRGNRWRLFCLQFSFIGWEILCSFTLGIGYLWLTPYTQSATAAFFRDITDVQARPVDAE